MLYRQTKIDRLEDAAILDEFGVGVQEILRPVLVFFFQKKTRTPLRTEC